MKLVVGLGNPGKQYALTRHNVGFECLAELARKHGTSKPKAAFQGEVVDADLSGVRTLLLAPHTFMNRSGSSVAKALEFYKLPHTDLLVVCDDFHLPVATLRCRAKGTSGGQKGLADIIRCLGTEEFARLRIGIGEPPPNRDPADYVLGRFSKEERKELEPTIWRAADAVTVWAREGIENCMNKYN